MKGIFIYALLAALIMPAGIAAQTMADEERLFLASMPPGLQAAQEQAVRDAIAGDFSALQAVRNSRNVAVSIPDNVKARDINGIYRLYTPRDTTDKKLPLLIYLHGGGWCFGSINSCSEFCAGMVADGGIAVLAVDYPLAPENPYPAALDCCLEAVRFAFGNCMEYGLDAQSISIGGDSAGGNLALCTALRLHSETSGNYRLKSVLAVYPVVKAWADGSDSWRSYSVGYGLDGTIMEAFNEAYICGDAADNPFISPYCASDSLLAGLPPVMIINAEHDILHDQGAEMESKLRDNGVNVDRKVLQGTSHLFITVAGQEAARRQAVILSRRFLLSALTQEQTDVNEH